MKSVRFKRTTKFALNYDIISKAPIKKNIMEIPQISKIVLNLGLIKTLQNKKQIIPALLALQIISGQSGVVTKSKKQIYQYKIRKGMIVGAASTLRGKLVNLFLEKFIIESLPNYSGFYGFPYSKTKYYRNGVTISLKEISIFNDIELKYNFFENLNNLDVTFVFNTDKIFKKNPNLMFLLLCQLNVPLITTKKI